MSNKRIIIIGAGIAGLSAGCYAQMSGFETQIFEMHNIPGGQCTAWKRKGFTFDGCIHHLAGCKPGSSLYSMWQELGALPTGPIVFPENLCRVEDESGKSFNVYTDLDRLKQHMIELSPQDSATINSYIKGIRTFTELDILDTPLLSSVGFAKRSLKLINLRKWGIQMKTFADKFKDPFLRKTFPTIQYNRPDNPMLVHLNMMGNCITHNYGVPAGGSLEFSRAIEKRYGGLGGTMNYNARVERILVENNHAVGVRLADGSEHRSDIVISDAFAHSVIFGLLDGQYVDESIRRQFSQPVDNMVMGIHVSFGLSRDLSKELHALVLFLEKPVKIADREHDRLAVGSFGYDPSFAPAGKSVLRVLLNTSYSFWKELQKQPEKYRSEKQRVAATVLEALEQRFPQISDQVEVVDVATPMTTERYTGVAQSYESNLGFGAVISLAKGQPKTLPGLESFFMVGATAGVAGIPGCAAMGRNLIRRICKAERVPFTPDAQPMQTND